VVDEPEWIDDSIIDVGAEQKLELAGEYPSYSKSLPHTTTINTYTGIGQESRKRLCQMCQNHEPGSPQPMAGHVCAYANCPCDRCTFLRDQRTTARELPHYYYHNYYIPFNGRNPTTPEQVLPRWIVRDEDCHCCCCSDK